MVGAFLTAVLASGLIAKADDAIHREKVVCTALKEEGEVPLVPVDGEPAGEYSLDLDKARADISAATSNRKFNVPGTEGQVWYTVRYVPVDGEKPEHIEVSTMFAKKHYPPIDVPAKSKAKPKSKSKSAGASAKMPVEPKPQAPALPVARVSDGWEMIPQFPDPGIIAFPMTPGQITGVVTPEIDVIPPLELDCQLVRERVKQDCVDCR